MGRKPLFVSVVMVALPLMAGCMPDTPETQLTWDVNTRMPRYPARATAPSRTYAYDDKRASAPRPLTRPAPQAAPARVASVDSKALPPIDSKPLPPVAPAADAPAFAWPVSGRVVSDFGATETGGRNDGINIAAAAGTPIHAAASGTVTYAGDALKNYGNLVLVKHAGGYTTAYAHAQRLVVQKGDAVTKGQVIGYTGQTGDVTTPQLHFEIRQQTTPLNPRTYLTATTASNAKD